MTKYKAIIFRFARVFVSGGLAALVVQLATVPHLSTLEEMKTWISILAVSFIAGGIAALDKALRYN